MPSTKFLIVASHKFAGQKVEVICTFCLMILFAEFLANGIAGFSSLARIRIYIQYAKKGTQMEIKAAFSMKIFTMIDEKIVSWRSAYSQGP